MLNEERKHLLHAFSQHKHELEKSFESKVEVRLAKSPPLSENQRKEGNDKYLEPKHADSAHTDILFLYSRSLALAPVDSELQALSYGNRSAFLHHMNMFEDCVKDINRALRITNSNALKIKLLCRKAESLKALGSTDYEKALELARLCLDKVGDSDSDKWKFRRLIETTAAGLVDIKIVEKVEPEVNEDVAKILAERELANVLDEIKICYNEKHGRHLIAKKDFNPGDVLFVEKLYTVTLFPVKMYTLCNWCLKTCWSGIPCNDCGWTVFCDEECRQQAWDNYHKVECAVLPHNQIFKDEMMHEFFMSIRLMILALNEYGSIEKLRAELKSIDDWKVSDPITKGFMKDGKFDSNSFKSIYCLKSDEIPDSLWNFFSLKAIHLLICLLERSSLLGNKFSINKIEDLKKNEDAMFLGCLFIRLCIIQSKNAHYYETNRDYCPQSKDHHNDSRKQFCCDYGLAMAPFASLINHSCHANVARCFTEDHKIVIYAIQPIKKNSEIFDNYSAFEFNVCPKFSRQNYLNQRYNFKCDCPACTQNWKTFPFYINGDTLPFPQVKFLTDYNDVLEVLNSRSTADKKTIKKLSKGITSAAKHFKDPCEVKCLLIKAMKTLCSNLYGLKPQFYGDCNKS